MSKIDLFSRVGEMWLRGLCCRKGLSFRREMRSVLGFWRRGGWRGVRSSR